MQNTIPKPVQPEKFSDLAIPSPSFDIQVAELHRQFGFQARPCAPIFDTGSKVLNHLAEAANARFGCVLHLTGQPETQLAVSFAMCKAACERGQESVFLDIDAALTKQTLEHVGLSPYCAQKGAAGKFHILRPQTLSDIDATLEALGQRSTVPALVILNSPMRALQNRWRNIGDHAPDLDKAGIFLYNLERKYRLIGRETGMTVVVAHPWLGQSVVTNDGRQLHPNDTLPGRMHYTLRNNCLFRIQLGWPYEAEVDTDHVLIPVQGFYSDTPLPNGPQTIVLSRNGQFCN